MQCWAFKVWEFLCNLNVIWLCVTVSYEIPWLDTISPRSAASLGTGWTQLTSSATVPSTFGSAWPSASFTTHYSNSTLNIELSNPLWAFYGFHCYNVRALCSYFFFPLRKWKAWLLFLFHGGEGSWSTEIKVKPLPLFSNWDSRNQFLICIFLKYLSLYRTWYFQRRAPTVLSPSSLSALELWKPPVEGRDAAVTNVFGRCL